METEQPQNYAERLVDGVEEREDWARAFYPSIYPEGIDELIRALV